MGLTPPSEDKGMRLQIDVSPEAKRRLQLASMLRDKTMSEIVEDAIMTHLPPLEITEGETKPEQKSTKP